jgi:hypothetical protein
MLSEPAALYGFKFDSNFAIPFSVMFRSCIVGYDWTDFTKKQRNQEIPSITKIQRIKKASTEGNKTGILEIH